MSSTPEEDLIDQSLRDAFQDYHLPPVGHMHVWAGVEERIASLPTPSKGLPYRLIIPITAVLGVTVGWLLPRPAAWQSPPPAAPAVPPVMRVTNAPAATWPAAPTTDSESRQANTAFATKLAEAAAVIKPSNSKPTSNLPARKRMAAATIAQAGSPAAPAEATPDPALPISSDSVPNKETAAATIPKPQPTVDGADSTLVAPAGAVVPNRTAPIPLHAANSPAAPEVITKRAAKTSKEGRNDEKIVYRKPTHRQPEGKNGIRRWFSHLTQGLHKIF
ncbi:hypothetical protein [Hymenobacter terrenus]|uniref:hypothetical protein n=1 Tax=Hymenobacter terrenus TaxID=1629124 RepID=UPI000619884D|nr:hypothetical protein [Hymenobacter terrenus]